MKLSTLLAGCLAGVASAMNPKHGCCAGDKSGELTTSFVGVADWGHGANLLKGYVAFDKGIERKEKGEDGTTSTSGEEEEGPVGHHGKRIPARAAMGLGLDRNPENSVLGWCAVYCPCKDTYFATAWMHKRCVRYKISAAKVKVPNACVGKDTAYSHYKETYAKDPDTRMHLYTDRYGISHIAVEHDSCHPFESLVWMQRSPAGGATPLAPGGVLAGLGSGGGGGVEPGVYGGQPTDASVLEAVLAALGSPQGTTLGGPAGLHHHFHTHHVGGEGIHHKNRFVALSFVNSTAKVEDDNLFMAPSYCKQQGGGEDDCPCASGGGGGGWREL